MASIINRIISPLNLINFIDLNSLNNNSITSIQTNATSGLASATYLKKRTYVSSQMVSSDSKDGFVKSLL
jgi:hypothetical protein